MDVESLPRWRFDALTAPTRHPAAHRLWLELEWWTAGRESVIGAVVLDLTDRDYSWIVLGKGRDGCYRPFGLGHSKRDQKTARRELHAAMAAAIVPPAGLPDAAFAAADVAICGEGAAALGTTVEDMLAQVRATLDDWT